MTLRGKNRSLYIPASLAIVATLAACTTSHVIVGPVRAPIPAEQVRIYLRPPAQYEQVALLESSSRGSFAVTSQARTDKLVERLKKEAASLGANGIVLKEVADQSSGSIGSGFVSGTGSGSTTAVGTGISANLFAKGGSAVAIYVPEAQSVGNR